jgi:glycosyltransferase A (GT-A) superfamily protein (DUF2064 family)
MTAHIVAQALPLKESRNLKLEVRYDGGDDATLMRAWLGDAVTYRPQGTGDIGRRMARAFRDARDRGNTSIVVIGADIPEMTTVLLNRAFETIQNDTIVLGPAADGGYYLIGLPSRVMPGRCRTCFPIWPGAQRRCCRKPAAGCNGKVSITRFWKP